MLTVDDLGIEAACDLAEAGVAVAAVVDSREGEPDERLGVCGIEHLRGFVPVEARGSSHVTGVVVARGGERRTLAGRPRGDERRHGRPVRGARAGRRLGALRRRPARVRARPGARRACASPASRRARRPRSRSRPTRARGKQFVCYCEDVTTKDVHLSVEEGFRLARALEALHDRDDGAVPGQDVPPQLGPPDGARAGRRPRRAARRRDDRPAAAQPDQLLAPGRPRLRAGQAHLGAPLARRPRRQDALGRRLEAALRLRQRPRTRRPRCTSRSA